MDNKIQEFFNFEGREVRIVMIDGNPWFVLKDLCDILDLRSPDVRQRLSDDVVSTHTIPDSLGRMQDTTIVNEDGMYDVILESRKPEAKTFRKWVTGNVLPSIRKHGMYAMDELLDNPDLLISSLTKLKEERQLRLVAEAAKAQLEEVNKIIQPKATKWDNYLDVDGYMTMNTVSSILTSTIKEVGRNLLLEFLRFKEVLMANNTPYGRFMKMSPVRFKVVNKPNDHNNTTNDVTLTTVHGFDYISELVEEGFLEWYKNRKK